MYRHQLFATLLPCANEALQSFLIMSFLSWVLSLALEWPNGIESDTISSNPVILQIPRSVGLTESSTR